MKKEEKKREEKEKEKKKRKEEKKKGERKKKETKKEEAKREEKCEKEKSGGKREQKVGLGGREDVLFSCEGGERVNNKSEGYKTNKRKENGGRR